MMYIQNSQHASSALAGAAELFASRHIVSYLRAAYAHLKWRHPCEVLSSFESESAIDVVRHVESLQHIPPSSSEIASLRRELGL